MARQYSLVGAVVNAQDWATAHDAQVDVRTNATATAAKFRRDFIRDARQRLNQVFASCGQLDIARLVVGELVHTHNGSPAGTTANMLHKGQELAGLLSFL